MAVRLFITGGTLDKGYDELTGDMAYTQSRLAMMLKESRVRTPILTSELMLLDSMEMTTQQRQQILVACRDCIEDRVVVTHGTDTMVETAELLGKNITNKTIVLTGSIIPYAFGHSDALFNLGSAITAIQILDNGVYVAMNGMIFPWDNVFKNRQLGEFQRRN
jgi:L-asparaginase